MGFARLILDNNINIRNGTRRGVYNKLHANGLAIAITFDRRIGRRSAARRV